MTFDYEPEPNTPESRRHYTLICEAAGMVARAAGLPDEPAGPGLPQRFARDHTTLVVDDHHVTITTTIKWRRWLPEEPVMTPLALHRRDMTARVVSVLTGKEMAAAAGA